MLHEKYMKDYLLDEDERRFDQALHDAAFCFDYWLGFLFRQLIIER